MTDPATTSILVLYYSQSGDTERLVQNFVKPVASAGANVTWANIQPAQPYPYPWNLSRFFDVFPDCINGDTPEILPPSFKPDQHFDLIILAYQVWFLAPSLPIQAFMKSSYAQVLRDTPVITLIACRNMWHSASEQLQQKLIDLGSHLIGKIVVTHQGSPLATFITTPRLVLTGKKDKALGMLPPGGFAEEDIESVSQFGQQLVDYLPQLSLPQRPPLFTGLHPVEVNKRYILPEWVGITLYRPWARLIRLGGPSGSPVRALLVWLFALQLVIALPIVLLLCTIIRILFHPILNPLLESYALKLQKQSFD
ncbi:hypothetical protein [Synechocystis salina]|uniref:Dialkylrecorsinol condensing enzyme n=1 Tax=Synechocystis salina LEGE 00031 TaxID=1828736 RepID=A0ABR9VMK7_9SYNC|nr:hypothetical protein [Synechocystis salina]MBE9240018.1 hypothetical protein [Synechocystis salina LEGE 00041]MBE9252562.1 hypothetical protein [Synechocystis salina LEGE 00031]